MFSLDNHLQDSFEIPRGQHRGGDIEMGQRSGELGLDNFFKQVASMISVIGSTALVQDIDKLYDKLNKLLKKLQDAHEDSRAGTKADAMKGLRLLLHFLLNCTYKYIRRFALSPEIAFCVRKLNIHILSWSAAIKQRMEKDVDQVGKIARFVKSKIEELDRDNMANRQKPGCGKGTAVDRSRTATTVALRKKFKDKMSEFQTLRESIHQEHRQLVERRVFTVTGTRVDEETIDRMIETGDSEQIFQKAIREQGRGQIMDTLAEIQERHDAVREVERKLLELQQIFLDMAVLVDAQGDMLDNIETHVSNAVDHVQSGNNALQKAKTLQRNSRKWMCIAILILLIIVVVVVVGVLKPWNSNKGA
ncbi:hypothetical protein RJ639_038004 [Escallonia herrerae]|uniref:t-SNARE coiled-coil homology domain-containing protein n=1 Tax=Escallonia herrerae TaxID=1293975 RepID=A0AA88WL75_9ASTE|nr:hypothetical protein RJ639_038004 [Escallonia herrerae]